MVDINEAISNFEKFNDFLTDDYCSKANIRQRRKVNRHISMNNQIGSDVFHDRVEKWLESAKTDVLKSELLHLLSNYNYLTESDYEDKVYDMIEEIKNDSSVNIDRFLFLLLPSAKYYESGSSFIYAAIKKYYLGEITRYNFRLLASRKDLPDPKDTDYEKVIARYSKELNLKLNNYDVIVFIDDIMGSGSTLLEHIEPLAKAYPTIKDKMIYISCLCKNDSMIKPIIDEIETLYFHVKKVVSSINQSKCYDQSHISYNYDIIKEHEDLITNSGKFSMGYENGQFLISFYYNTPNNTLSSFWLKSEHSQYPLFIRDRQTYDISDIALKKELNATTAYNMGIK